MERECAGILVGRALERRNQSNNFTNLINRIINKAKSIFYSITGNEVKKMLLEGKIFHLLKNPSQIYFISRVRVLWGI